MCDPVTAMVVGGIGSVGSGLMGYMGQQQVLNDQNNANAQWIAYQKQASADEMAKDEAARQVAEAARQQTLTQVSAPAQKADQTAEAARLNTAYGNTGDASTMPGAEAVVGSKYNSADMNKSLGAQVSQAAADARSRISALATINSYGNSSGGLGTVIPLAFNAGQQQIGLQSDIRQGNLAAYQVAKNVEPVRYQATPSPWQGIATSLAGIAGGAAGSVFGKNAASTAGQPISLGGQQLAFNGTYY